MPDGARRSVKRGACLGLCLANDACDKPRHHHGAPAITHAHVLHAPGFAAAKTMRAPSSARQSEVSG